MPSPFPGMDPYLENPLRWQSVHALLITFLYGTLNHSLPEGYVAQMEERIYVLGEQREFRPDVAINRPLIVAPQGSGIATLERQVKATSTEPRVLRLAANTITERFLTIVSRAEIARDRKSVV